MPLPISVKGTRLVAGPMGVGNPLILQGGNFSGLENSCVQGFQPWADDNGEPNWAQFAVENGNLARIPLNQGSWLGDTVYPTADLPITFSTTPLASSTGGSLTNGNWAATSGKWMINFSAAGGNDSIWLANFTNGSPTVTWAALPWPSPSGVNARAVVWGTPRNADPFANYKAAVIKAVNALTALNCYIILDLHWTDPPVTFGTTTHYLANKNQSPFMDMRSLDFWTSIANQFKSFPNVMFELFNEPFANGNSGVCYTGPGGTGTLITDKDALLLTGGYSQRVENVSQDGSNQPCIGIEWRVAGYQQAVNAILATGAQNVLILNGNQYAQQIRSYAKYTPTGVPPWQLAYGVHPYPNAASYAQEVNGNPYPQNGFIATGAGDATIINDLNGVVAAGKCVVITEDGDWAGAACPAAPHLKYMHAWCDANKVPHVVWQWNSAMNAGVAAQEFFCHQYVDNTFTKVVTSTGQGIVTRDWWLTHPQYTNPGGGPSPVLPGPVTFGGRVILPAKRLGETVILAFDFISKLAKGETIAAALCVSQVYTGFDPTPENVIGAATPTIASTTINQLVTGGTPGTIYTILARATTSLGQVVELSGYLAVLPDYS